MKKFAAILCAVIGVLAVLAFAFQGLPWKYRIINEYGDFQELESEDIVSDVNIPDTWSAYGMYGAEFYAPAGMEYREEEMCYASADEKLHIYVFSDESSEAEYVEELLADLDITPDEMKYFCEKTGKEYPENEYELSKTAMYLKKSDLDIHNCRSAHTFYKLYELIGCQTGRKYCFNETSDLKGFYMITNEPEYDGIYVIAKFYDKNDKYYHICESSEDEELNLQIAETLHLTNAWRENDEN